MSYYNSEELINLENTVTELKSELQAKTDLLSLVVVEKCGLVEEIAQLKKDKKELREALSRIQLWGELSIKKRCDIGSNGQRDYYRNIAANALNK